MGRRRQHHGGLALASDQIPGLAQHNINLGLATSAPACQASRKPTGSMVLQATRKGKLRQPNH